jgi:hypothetical protein
MEKGPMDAKQFATIMAGITEVKTKQDDMRRELLGNGQPGRIQILEDRVDKHSRNQWLHSTIIVPLNFILHAMAAHFGFKG